MTDIPTSFLRRWALSLLCLALTPPTLSADHASPGRLDVLLQDSAPAQTPRGAPSPFPQVAELEASLDSLGAALETTEGGWDEILRARSDRTLDRLVEVSHDIAREVLRRNAGGTIPDQDLAQMRDLLGRIPPRIVPQLTRQREVLEFPRLDQTAEEQAALSAAVRIKARRIDRLIGHLISNLEMARQVGMDTEAFEATLRAAVAARAENNSDYLYVVARNLDELRLQEAALPKDPEILAKISVTERHLRMGADALRQAALQMEALGLDASAINAQLISATGALTTEIFKWSVIREVLANTLADAKASLSAHGAGILFRTFLFLIILFVAWRLARLAERLTLKALQSARMSLSLLLQRTIVSGVRSVIMVLGLLLALSQLGVDLGPVLAGLGIAGFILGFALQDSLSNFASGIMILIYRPFDVGDVVEVSGAMGKVSHMSLVNTTVLTVDNQRLVVPNNKVWQNLIKNLTVQTTRRVDLVFGISYSDDVEKAEQILADILRGHDRILKEPEPLIKLHELGESSVNFIVRPWVNTDDYWDVYWDITREVKIRFDDAGITIPFPQRDIHVHPASPSPGSFGKGESD